MEKIIYEVLIVLLFSIIIIGISVVLLSLFILTFFKLLRTVIFGKKISLIPYSQSTEKMYEHDFFLGRKGYNTTRLQFKSRVFQSPANPNGIVPCLNHRLSRYYPRRFPSTTQPWPLKYWRDSKGKILLVHDGYRTILSLVTIFLIILLMLFLLFSGIWMLLEFGQLIFLSE